MLRNIYIKSFRSCSELRIDNIDELTILVGRNGVGKSNILKSINWCAKVATSVNAHPLISPVNSEVKIQVSLNGEDYIYSVASGLGDIDSKPTMKLTEKLLVGSRGNFTKFFERDGTEISVDGLSDPLIVGPAVPAMSSIFGLMPNHPFTEKLKCFFNFLNEVEYYPLVEFENAGENYDGVFITQEQFSQWLINRSAENSSKAILAKILDFYLNKTDKFQELLSLLGEDGIGLISKIGINEFELPKNVVSSPSVGVESSKEKTKIYFVSFVPLMSGSDEGHRFDNLSFGTKRLIRFITDFLYDDASISLVEQPEDGVHCGLLYKLFDLLASYSEGRQTIVASHSADLLNRADPSSIRLVEMSSGITAVRELTGQEQSAADEFKKNSGTLSEFLRSLQEE